MITVSFCAIVKNEEAVLERCLEGFAPVCDEIIIVDTGSTDRTKEIAHKYTDKVYDFEWVDDFSAARNFAFSKANCDYIYSADADEVLDEANREQFKILKEAMLPEIEIVQMWYINKHEFKTTENYERDLRPKLYKRLREFTWIEPVHEEVRLDPVVFDSDVEILHMPISAHQKRDFRIFEKMVSELEEGKLLSRRIHNMYATELMLSGDAADFKKAYDYFDMAMHSQSADSGIKAECCCVLAKGSRLAGRRDDFFRWSLKNISTIPVAEVCTELGLYYFDAACECEKSNDLKSASAFLEEASVWFLNASEETEAVLCADSAGKIPLEMLAHVYEKIAGLDPAMREQALSIAAEYKYRSSHVGIE